MSPAANLPFDVNAFIDKHKSAFSAEELNGFNELTRGYLRDSDYQRNMNKLKTDHNARMAAEDEFHTELEAYRDEHNQLLQLKNEVEEKFGGIDKFRATSDPSLLRTPSGDLVSRKETEKLIAELNALKGNLQETRGQLANFATGSLGLIAKLPALSETHREKYKKPLDGVKFLEFINENNISDLDAGYKLFTLEDDQKFVETKHAADLVAAREEGARDFATRHRIPEDHGTRRGLFARHDVPLVKTAPQHTIQTPAAPPAPVVTPNTVATNSTRLSAAIEGANDLRSSIQQRFLEAKDK